MRRPNRIRVVGGTVLPIETLHRHDRSNRADLRGRDRRADPRLLAQGRRVPADPDRTRARACARAAMSSISGVSATTSPSGWVCSEDINRVGYHVQELRIVDDDGRRQRRLWHQGLRGADRRPLRDARAQRSVAIAVRRRSEVGTKRIFGDEIAGLRRADGDGVHVRAQAWRRAPLRSRHRRRRSAFGRPQAGVRAAEPVREASRLFGSRRSRPPAIGRATRTSMSMYGQPGRHGRAVSRCATTGRCSCSYSPTDDAPLPHDARRLQKAMLRESVSRRRLGMPADPRRNWIARLTSISISVSQIRMDAWSQGRVALVGDAAFCVSLLAGQGSALAMTSAYVLAGELARAQRPTRRGLSQLRNDVADLISRQAAGRRALCRRPSRRGRAGARLSAIW